MKIFAPDEFIPSSSPMASPFFFCQKERRKSYAPLKIIESLNDATIKNRYPLPLISETYRSIGHAKSFSKWNVRWGYKQYFDQRRWRMESSPLCTNIRTSLNQNCHVFWTQLIPRYLPIILMKRDIQTTHWQRRRCNLHGRHSCLHQTLTNNTLLLYAKYSRSYTTTTYFQNQEEMCFSPIRSRIFRTHRSGNKQSPHGPYQNIRNSRLACTKRRNKNLQRFLGFCNFYRRFIKDYSKIAKNPSTILTGDVHFRMDPHSADRFSKLSLTPLLLNQYSHYLVPLDKFRLEADSKRLCYWRCIISTTRW